MRFGNMHAREGVVDYIVFLFAEGHGVDLVPYLLNLGTGRDALARLLDVFFVELDGRLEHADLALGFLLTESVIDIADVGAENVAASAAALYIFDSRLAEECDSCSARERQSVKPVFEQNHTLAGGLSRERGVLGRTCDLSAVRAERDAGLISESCVFVHSCSPSFI